MATEFGRGSATIYAFPKKAREPAAGGRETTNYANVASLQLARSAIGGSWYHEAAMAEERAPNKH